MIDTLMHPAYPFLGSSFGIGAVFIAILFFAIAVWSFVWKAFGLWYAARNKQRLWFVALLLINTAGLLEIIYIVWFRKDNAGTDTLVVVPEQVHETFKKSTKSEKKDDLPVAESSPE